jgi:hypothetical protein
VFNQIKKLIMKQKEETKTEVTVLSREELENTFGGSWWEVRAVYGKLVFIFHCC